VSAGAPLAQALAYADDCLAPDERRAFERRMAADPALAARIEQWRRQNEAIRQAFADVALAESAAPATATVPPPLRRDFGRRRQSPFDADATGRSLARSGAPPQPGEIARPAPRRRLPRRGFALFAAAFALVWSAAPAPRDASADLASAAFSAFRTFADGGAPEFATTETAALETWLRGRLGGWLALPDLGAAGLTLVGGRVISGAEGPAAFALYRDRAGARVGLTVESSETAAPPLIRASGALVATALAAPGPEQATLVAVRGEVDIGGLARRADFPTPERQATP